jgi:hypothetical protein
VAAASSKVRCNGAGARLSALTQADMSGFNLRNRTRALPIARVSLGALCLWP